MAIKLMSYVGLAGNLKLPRITRTKGENFVALAPGVSDDSLVDDPNQFVPSGA